jgi:hypothetical protein
MLLHRAYGFDAHVVELMASMHMSSSCGFDAHVVEL